MEENTPQLPPVNPVVKAISHLIIIMGLYFMFTVLFGLLALQIVQLLTGINLQESLESIATDITNPDKVWAYKIFQLVVSAGSFIGTSIVFAKVFAKEEVKSYFGFRSVVPPAKIMGLVIIIAVSSIPVLSYIAYLNGFISLPEGLEQGALKAQQNAETINSAFLQAPNIGVLLFNLVLVAIVPALGEEMLFRGAFLQIFHTITGRRIHLAVFFVAVLFAAIHMQFYNLLAIIFMGVVFGYLYYWSGNIMVPVWAHMINNGLVVIGQYMYQHNTGIAFLSYDYEFSAVPALVGAVIFTGAMVAFYRVTKQYHPADE